MNFSSDLKFKTYISLFMTHNLSRNSINNFERSQKMEIFHNYFWLLTCENAHTTNLIHKITFNS